MKDLLFRILLLTCLSFSVFNITGSHQHTYLQASKEESAANFQSYNLPDLPIEH